MNIYERLSTYPFLSSRQISTSVLEQNSFILSAIALRISKKTNRFTLNVKINRNQFIDFFSLPFQLICAFCSDNEGDTKNKLSNNKNAKINVLSYKYQYNIFKPKLFNFYQPFRPICSK